MKRIWKILISHIQEGSSLFLLGHSPWEITALSWTDSAREQKLPLEAVRFTIKRGSTVLDPSKIIRMTFKAKRGGPLSLASLHHSITSGRNLDRYCRKPWRASV